MVSVGSLTSMYLSNPSASGKMWLKVIFLSGEKSIWVLSYPFSETSYPIKAKAALFRIWTRFVDFIHEYKYS